MFIVRLRGGLGNQLYEYAFCAFLKKFTDDVYVDGTEFKTFQCHDGLEVDKIFDIDLPYASRKRIMELSNYIPIPVSGKIGIGLFELEGIRERWWCKKHRKKTHVKEKDLLAHDMDYVTDFLNRNKQEDLYFDGYWSDVRILERLDDGWINFRKGFVSQYSKYMEDIDFDMACSVHVRKGDIDGTSIDVCGKEYYKKAVEHINSIRSDVEFIVFSDELDKARNIITEDLAPNIRFIDTTAEKTAGVDIYLMSLCRDNIIVNSSYSYWGSRLNNHRDKCVIIPAQYSKMRYDGSVVI